MTSHTQPNDNPDVRRKAEALLKERRETLRTLGRLEGQLRELLSPGERRELDLQLSGLRGSVTYIGDIVSPTGEAWDAEA